jgi:tryptophanyl-tRNA synthetase
VDRARRCALEPAGAGTRPQRVMTGLRPSGELHIGNYLGAIRTMVELQDRYTCFFEIADWHMLTTGYEDTSQLRESVEHMLVTWIAAGIDPEKATVFVQSDVPQHAELALLLGMVTPLSWLERVPTYKEQLKELTGRDIATYGFLGYPVLQAADILAYRAQLVPVGRDQLPHLEITREMVRRFHHLYGPVFPEPQPLLTEAPLVPGTDGRKMSKSYGNTIALDASPEEVRARVRTMVTDPAKVRRGDPGHPEVCPVFALHRALASSGMAIAQERLEAIDEDCRRGTLGCVECKGMLAEEINLLLEPMRQRRSQVRREDIADILAAGSGQARAEAEETLAQTREAMHLWTGRG